MSGWYYMKEGVFSDSEVGPLADNTLLQMAFDGALQLKSKVRHPAHTKGQWVYLENIPAAKQKIEAGQKHRADAEAAEKAARAARAAEVAAQAEAKRQAQLAQQTQAAEAFARSPIARFLSDGQDAALVSKVYDRVSQLLTSQESVDYIAVAMHVPGIMAPDCVVATNRRFMVVHQKILGRMDFEDYVWLDLHDAQLKEGMLSSEITLRHVSGRTLKLALLPKSQARRIYRLCQEREEEARQLRHARMLEEKRAAAGGVHVNVPVSTAAASPTPDGDPMSRLQKLKQMLDAGLIQQAEYDETKRRILAAM